MKPGAKPRRKGEAAAPRPPGPDHGQGSESLSQLGRGTYALVLTLPRSVDLQVGRLGRFRFSRGVYAYAGSALGPGGLAARLGRHLSGHTALHWHVDHLMAASRPVEVWVVESEVRWEHVWAEVLEEMDGAGVPAAGFGASDCDCRTHLFAFPKLPAFSLFNQAVEERFPGTGPVKRAVLSSR